MKIWPLNCIDFYKADHRRQYPEGTTLVYSNFTPRASRIPDINKVIFFGLQYFVKEYLIDQWNRNFFNVDEDIVVYKYKRRMDNALGKNAIDVEHIKYLWNKRHLPIVIKAIPEGTRVNINSPVMTIYNTDPKCFWLTNYLETHISAELWKMCNNATIANLFRQNFDRYADETGADKNFCSWQGHDFSARGMSGLYDQCMSGAAHLLSFTGTDTVHAIDFLEEYYNANSDHEFIGGSVPATEHSVMCAAGEVNEYDTFKRLITEVYPKGIVSIVSDSWDYWNVITNIIPSLKDIIIERYNRNPGSKVVVRPDTGNPVKVICGDSDAVGKGAEFIPQVKGSIECLWDTFGGTITNKGYKVLHPSIGLIQGDSVNLTNQIEILQGLKNKGFASSNIVLGIGSYTYQYCTRDTLSFAMKATYAEVNGEGREIYKNPKTGSYKKSHKGLLRINEDGSVKEQCSWEEESGGLLREVFRDGKLLVDDSLTEIRRRVQNVA